MALKNMPNFEMWWDRNEVQGEQVIFPSLEQLKVIGCPELTTFPEAPKLREVELSNCRQQACLQAGSRYITSLSSLEVKAPNKEENSAELEVVREHKSPLRDLYLRGCDLFFSGSSALALWKCFGQLATLKIAECDALVYWPEKLFQGLVSLRTLEILMCNKLTGLTEDEASHKQSALVQRSGTLLPRLDFLVICGCESLVQVPNLSTSLKKLLIWGCKSIKSIAFGEQQDTTGLETSSSLIAAGSSSSSNEDESTVSTAVVLKPVSSSSASSNHCFFPCLEFLEINDCSGLTEVANLPPSIKTLEIWGCGSLVSVSGEVTSLEVLQIRECGCLQSLPNGPHQVYSSLIVLRIERCSGIKQLLSSLQQCLGHLEKKNLDPHLLQEQVELDSKPESMSDRASTSVVLKQSSSTGSNYCFFPCLESLEIYHCGGLTEVVNLPPSVKTLNIWGCGSLVSVSGEVTSLEELQIYDCGCLQSLPNGPHQVYSSLRVLIINRCPGIKQLLASLQQCLGHLEKKNLDPHLLQEQVELDSKPESMSDGASTSVVLKQSSSTGSNHCFFPCLESLEICSCGGLTEVANLPPSIKTLKIAECDDLVYWPEKLFQGLVSLRTLEIRECNKLTGLTEDEASHEQSALVQRSGTLLPLLESLEIRGCLYLVQVPKLSTSLKTLLIVKCKSLKSIAFGEQQDTTGLETSSPLIAAGSSSSSNEDESTLSTAVVLKPVSSSSSSSNHCFFPRLQSLEIFWCDGLTEVANLPPSIKTLNIEYCGSLVSLSGEVPSLEELNVWSCPSLESLPNGPAHQAYSSLRVLIITECPGIKQLPPSLQQRLDHLEEKTLDPHLLQGLAEPVSTGRIAALMSKLECFRLRSED
ncbi:unnamed protein product [Miscanthus lutarioriparius]|uniref:Uncharacterized protein n=1 Tax=Miscanthus lutarioriparius TaxID=422564 RepID=A0A811SI49_9POAL|nr:unnamed protein product [Miscanthus lutarioriparius]